MYDIYCTLVLSICSWNSSTDHWPRRSLSPSVLYFVFCILYFVCVMVFLWIEIGCVCWWILAPKPTFCPAAALKNWRDELWFATVLSNWFSFSTFIYNHKAVLGACRVSQCDREGKELRSDRLYTRLILIHTHNLQMSTNPTNPIPPRNVKLRNTPSSVAWEPVPLWNWRLKGSRGGDNRGVSQLSK